MLFKDPTLKQSGGKSVKFKINIFDNTINRTICELLGFRVHCKKLIGNQLTERVI